MRGAFLASLLRWVQVCHRIVVENGNASGSMQMCPRVESLHLSSNTYALGC